MWSPPALGWKLQKVPQGGEETKTAKVQREK